MALNNVKFKQLQDQVKYRWTLQEHKILVNEFHVFHLIFLMKKYKTIDQAIPDKKHL